MSSPKDALTQGQWPIIESTTNLLEDCDGEEVVALPVTAMHRICPHQRESLPAVIVFFFDLFYLFLCINSFI